MKQYHPSHPPHLPALPCRAQLSDRISRMRSPRCPTVIAMIAQVGEETNALGRTLASSAWRGVRRVLVTLHGSTDVSVQQAATRAAMLFGVESHFQWQTLGEEGAPRLARLFRALQPTLVLATQGTCPFVQEAWRQAADATIPLPGLSLFDPTGARVSHPPFGAGED